MKILTVQPFDFHGSIQRRSIDVALGLLKERMDTVFVTPKDGFSFTKIASEKGFRVYKTNNLRPVLVNGLDSLIHMIKWFVGIPKGIVEIYKIARVEQPDIIQVNGFVCIQEALVAAVFRRRRFLWNLIGTMYPRIAIVAFLPLIRLASLRVFVAKKLAHYYFGKPNDWVIYEPINKDQFSPEKIVPSQLENLREASWMHKDSFLIGFVGSICPAKGLEYLIQSMTLTKSECSNTKLIMVGRVPPFQTAYYAKLRNLIHKLGFDDDAVFVGYVKHDKVPMVLSLFDIFVLPSVDEGTPVCVLEAMAMNRPVIATDVGGVSEMINSGTGILVSPRDPEAISRAVIELIHNEDKRNRLGRKARMRIEKMFSLERCILEYSKLYQSISKADCATDLYLTWNKERKEREVLQD